MKKNEQLLYTIGEILPQYVEEAADGRVPQKTQRHRAPYGRFRAFGVLAAMLVVAAMMFALGMSVSAAEPDPENEEYWVGTMLMDIPEIILAEDFEALLAEVQAGVAADTNLTEDGRENFAVRFHAYYSMQSLEWQKSELAREGLLRAYPITEITQIYTVDKHLTECERDFLHHMLVTYTDTTQSDLIAYHQNMYDLTESSGLSDEKKQRIYDSLPDIPTLSPTAPPANYLTSEAEAAGKHQLTPLMLPCVLLAEDYENMRDAVLAKYGAEQIDHLPLQAQQMLNSYTKYPLELFNPDTHHLMTEQHFAELTAEMELYILPMTMTMEDRITLCYQLSTIADVWQEEGLEMTQHLHSSITERYGKASGNGSKFQIVSNYWENYWYLNHWIGMKWIQN